MKKKVPAQKIQDRLFQKMSPDRKLQLASNFWRFAKQLSGKKFSHAIGATKRSSTPAR